jgi:hypothetical protein
MSKESKSSGEDPARAAKQVEEETKAAETAAAEAAKAKAAATEAQVDYKVADGVSVSGTKRGQINGGEPIRPEDYSDGDGGRAWFDELVSRGTIVKT